MHCGRFLGEPEETTQVRTPRPQPASTIRAAIPLVPAFETIEKPRGRWPFRIGVALIAVLLLVIAGGLIAVALIYKAGGITVDLPDNNRLTVLTPSPSREPTQRSRSIATPEQVRPTPETNRQSNNLEKGAIPTPQVREVPIFNQTVGVGAGRFYSFRFTLVKTARLIGRFQAFGGSNDIAAAILDDDSFPAFNAGQATRAYYASAGYVTTDSVNLVLGPRTYYLTFDNRKAMLTPKTVVANFVIAEP